MTVGELFVSLGIRGHEKTIGALSQVKKGMGDLASMSLEAKAAIVGALYALERTFSASGAAGTGLTQFGALTGLSMKQLQEWQYAARQAGVGADEFSGSVKAVQGAMTNMLLGKGAPEGLAMLANKVGFDPKRARDTFYVLDQLQKFAKTVPADVGNSVMKSFGISEGTISAMRRSAFRPEIMAKAPTYSSGEIGALDRANIAWKNLGAGIEMAVGRFNARHGPQLVRDISMITVQMFKLADALEKVATRFKLFEVFGHMLEGMANVLKLINEVADRFEGKEAKPGDLTYSPPQGQKGMAGKPEETWLSRLLNFSSGGPQSQFMKNLMDPSRLKEGTNPPPFPAVPGMAITPPVPTLSGAGKSQTINIKQDLHFQHEGKDAKQTSDAVKKANQDAFRQFALGQVS